MSFLDTNPGMGCSVSHKDQPEVISLTEMEVDSLKQRIIDSQLVEPDKKIVLAVLSLNFWLQTQLSLAKLTIRSLKRFFGFRTEKKTLKYGLIRQMRIFQKKNSSNPT